ncbi:MAG: hypothetical protein HYZ27_10670, partial [Deltaproteobacteria bacterium]|nr:hypothetical protein [Deltaproteobacteria bacterium]
FGEDGLRPLRAVRFAAVLDFALARATERALAGALPTFAKVAWERKRDEMERLLGGATKLRPALRTLLASGMLSELAPELGAEPGVARPLERLGLGRPWLRLTAWGLLSGLEPTEIMTLFDRWRIGTAARDAAVAQAKAVLALGKARPTGARLRAWASEAGVEHAEIAALLAQALKGSAFRKFPQQVKSMLETRVPLSIRDLRVSGSDLLNLGVTGKAVGHTLRGLLAAVLNDPSANERNTLLTLAHTLSTTHRVKNSN